MNVDFSKLIGPFQSTLGESTPKILAAIGILFIGWLISISLRAAVHRGLGFLKLNERISSSTNTKMDLEGGLAKGAYYTALLLVLVAMFNVLDLTVASEPIQVLVSQVLDFVPKFFAAGLLLLLAWIVASVVRGITTRALNATQQDEKLMEAAGMPAIGDSVGNVFYWLIFLFFTPAIIGVLEMNGLLAPVQGLLNEILSMLPNIFGAGVIGIVGWFLAKILRSLCENLLATTGLDAFGKKAGLEGTMALSKLGGLIVFIFVFVPALIMSLDALHIEAISKPATAMLQTLLGAIPNVFAAALILTASYLVGSFVATLGSNILGGFGLNALPSKVGLSGLFSGKNSITPSELAGKVIMFFVMLFAVTEAAGVIGFHQVEELVSTFIQFGSQILLGMIILLTGMWLSDLAYTTIKKVGNNASMASLVRFAILGLVIAMGLRSMGIADDIVNIAFTLTLGSIAVAVALSFGLGGREAAGKQMEHWLNKLR